MIGDKGREFCKPDERSSIYCATTPVSSTAAVDGGSLNERKLISVGTISENGL